MARRTDSEYMQIALEAARSSPEGEVPVGAVVVRQGEVVAVGCNRRETGGDATAHAEVEAIRAACRRLGGWNLSGCTLYVTLEPCPMCAGAILQSHIDRVVFGARDDKGGAAGSVCDLFAMPFPARVLLKGGVLEQECAALLRDFFANSLRGGEKKSCNYNIAEL